jgi:hypothetical protein
MKIDIMTKAVIDGNLCGADCPHLEQDPDACWALQASSDRCARAWRSASAWRGEYMCLLYRAQVGRGVRCPECRAAKERWSKEDLEFRVFCFTGGPVLVEPVEPGTVVIKTPEIDHEAAERAIQYLRERVPLGLEIRWVEVPGEEMRWQLGWLAKRRDRLSPPMCVRCGMPIEEAYTMTGAGPTHPGCVA